MYILKRVKPVDIVMTHPNITPELIRIIRKEKKKLHIRLDLDHLLYLIKIILHTVRAVGAANTNTFIASQFFKCFKSEYIFFMVNEEKKTNSVRLPIRNRTVASRQSPLHTKIKSFASLILIFFFFFASFTLHVKFICLFVHMHRMQWFGFQGFTA